MFSRRIGVRMACLSTPLAALLLIAWIVTNASGDWTRLDREVLTKSRGSNVGNVLTSSSCRVLNGFAGCLLKPIGTPCYYCTGGAYTDTKKGTSGGYNTGLRGAGCGTKQVGTCGAAAFCNFPVAAGPCKAKSLPTVQVSIIAF